MTWAVRATWLLLPFTVGDALGTALDPRSRPVQLVVVIGCWLGWAAGFLPRTVGKAGSRG